MFEGLKAIPWQERVKMLEAYQKERSLSLRSLAEEFNYSIGKLSYELTLAQALDIYPELKKIKYITDAIRFIKKRKFHRECD